MNRRGLLAGIVGLGAALPLVKLFAGDDKNATGSDQPGKASPDVKQITKSEAEWKQELSEQEFQVLREEATEAPNSSPLNKEKREGMFVCAGCALPLFKSEWKFHSGTGWPSFFDHIEGHLQTQRDYKMIFPRTEYHCARCGGHQGHVFGDGPEPTGERWCNNGVALHFEPADGAKS